MKKIILQPTTKAGWYTLVEEAHTKSGYHFDDHIKNYLMLTLSAFMKNPTLSESSVALKFLEGTQVSKSQSATLLRDVGDECLLLSGLFPERALKRNVSLDYYVGCGQQAYHLLACNDHHPTLDPSLFRDLSQHFIGMMDVLHLMRH